MVAASRHNYRKPHTLALFPSQKDSRVGRANRSCLTGRIARRPAKRRHTAKKFTCQLKILMCTRAPTVFRAALATNLVSLARRHRKNRRWIRIKGAPALYSIVRALMHRMVAEKEPEIRSAFLRLLTIEPFFRTFDTFDWSYGSKGIECIMEVLEQELTEEEQSRALFLLGYVTRFNLGHDLTRAADQFVKIGVCMIHKHLDPTMPSLSESSIRRLIFCMTEFMWMVRPPLDPIIASPHAMRFFINGLRDTRILPPLVYPSVRRTDKPERASKQYGKLVSSIFKYAPSVSRQQLIDRHFVHVQEAILLMPIDYQFRMFAVYEEFANVIVRMPIVLGKLATEVRNAGNRYSYSHDVIMALFHGLRNNDTGVQVLLGYGVLAVVTHFAREPYGDYSHDRDIASFRRILRTHPEWKRRFKEYTRGGDARSETYQLGAAIVIRDRKPVQYILTEDAVDI